jgi:Flp pilus assembly pilin Flp
MTKLFAFLRSLARDERGQDLIEYALLASMIAIFSIAGLLNASGEVNTIWEEIATGIKNAVP